MRTTTRRALKIAAWIAGGLAAAALIAIAAGALWLRGYDSHEWVRRRLTEFVNARIAGELRVGRVRGSLWRDLTLDGVELRNRHGRIAARARAVYAHYHPWGLVRHRPFFDTLVVEAAEVRVAEVEHGQLDLSPLRRWLREHNRRLRVRDLFIHGARVELPRGKSPLVELDELDARGSLEFADHHRRGFVELDRVRAVAAFKRGPRRALAGAGRYAFDPETIARGHARLEIGGTTRLLVAGRLTHDRLDLDRVTLAAAPELLHQLSPKEAPPDQILVELRAHGPRGKVHAQLDVHPGPGEIHADATVDTRRWTATAVVDHRQLDGAYFPNHPRFTIDARLHASARRTPRGWFVDGVIDRASGMIGNAFFDRGSLNGWIDRGVLEVARAGMDVPGGSVSGRGRVGFDGNIALDLRVNVNSPSKLLAALHGRVKLPAPPKGRSLVSIDGALLKARKRKAHFVTRKIGLGKSVARAPSGSPL
ncbi:MAG TPA: hypothetical protein VFF06_19810 [Polyangia bacterium]|nr:hypothetical protein [Polyangia bacterium]